jgi:hypothetical protein
VRWLHDLPDEPTWLYSAVVEGRERRKIEVFCDGRMDFADDETAAGTAVLSETLMPTVEEIAANPQVMPVVIDATEFEVVWRLTRR